MSFRAVGINSHKEYAMAQHKAELMKKLELIYPSFQQNINLNGRITKQARSKIYPEPIRIVKGTKYRTEKL
ncbi:hypothetical protein [Lentilactobacillus hilgardii]|uniref:hypothetical protein n=2 Tax=Lentilactobacillus hilgardii TaxID=1588 RepID=UPI0021A8C32D|nr:hypothetical protein [Lentilactobacillus hilgardii]MCP9333432.1 hypothetical protein [Lentilactobacillus hilgardii]MCP9350011.1 hypothetical protein [Lentilactobacillus hilgardii]MCP9352589.1 hypothetical protein [Lentilactobacillus hilgardii]MCT3395886.1 hypothetical protein [Lentilactobacillus hilgardii]